MCLVFLRLMHLKKCNHRKEAELGMKRYYTRLIAILLVMLFSAPVSTMCTAYANNSDTTNGDSTISKEVATAYFDQAIGLIMSRYKFDTTRENIYRQTLLKLLEKNPEMIYDYFDAMFGSLDDYSTYYTQEELDTFVTNVSGEFCGIGVLIMTVPEGLYVSNVYANSPASEAGLAVGDIIVKVHDTPLAGVDISIAQSLILGKENTSVNLTVLRNGATFEINPVRRKVTIETGFYDTINNDSLGYIYFSDFNSHAVDLTIEALSHFDQKGIKRIIIDLRNNPGGELTAFVEIASLFIPKGPAIKLEYKNPFNNTTLESVNNEVKYTLGLLINENSASAAEAFAAAVKDTKVGILFGTKTFGKGTMQILTRFKMGGGVKLTEAEFLSPLGNKINKIGVAPNIKVNDKMVDYHMAGFEKITYDRVLKIGDEGKDVLAVEERLYAMGFDIGGLPDEIYDEKTYNAIFNLQNTTKLYPYGVADITTQLKIEELLQGTQVSNNASFKKAVEMLSGEGWRYYVNTFNN